MVARLVQNGNCVFVREMERDSEVERECERVKERDRDREKEMERQRVGVRERRERKRKKERFNNESVKKIHVVVLVCTVEQFVWVVLDAEGTMGT